MANRRNTFSLLEDDESDDVSALLSRAAEEAATAAAAAAAEAKAAAPAARRKAPKVEKAAAAAGNVGWGNDAPYYPHADSAVRSDNGKGRDGGSHSSSEYGGSNGNQQYNARFETYPHYKWDKKDHENGFDGNSQVHGQGFGHGRGHGRGRGSGRGNNWEFVWSNYPENSIEAVEQSNGDMGREGGGSRYRGGSYRRSARNYENGGSNCDIMEQNNGDAGRGFIDIRTRNGGSKYRGGASYRKRNGRSYDNSEVVEPKNGDIGAAMDGHNLDKTEWDNPASTGLANATVPEKTKELTLEELEQKKKEESERKLREKKQREDEYWRKKKEEEREQERKEAEEDAKKMTLDEYDKLRIEKRKALEESFKAEERRVASDKDFESMQLVEKKKEESISRKLKSDKLKKKDSFDKGVKAHKVSIHEFLKSAEGEVDVRSEGSREQGGHWNGHGELGDERKDEDHEGHSGARGHGGRGRGGQGRWQGDRNEMREGRSNGMPGGGLGRGDRGHWHGGRGGRNGIRERSLNQKMSLNSAYGDGPAFSMDPGQFPVLGPAA